jgi:hypothetical protein
VRPGRGPAPPPPPPPRQSTCEKKRQILFSFVTHYLRDGTTPLFVTGHYNYESEHTYLEMILRRDLSWVDQVNYTVKKPWKALHFTIRILKKKK